MTEFSVIRFGLLLLIEFAALGVVAWILFWLEEKSGRFPHLYDTENSHEVTPGENSKCPVANCSICWEGR